MAGLRTLSSFGRDKERLKNALLHKIQENNKSRKGEIKKYRKKNNEIMMVEIIKRTRILIFWSKAESCGYQSIGPTLDKKIKMK